LTNVAGRGKRSVSPDLRSIAVSISERKKELKRRRHRRQKMSTFTRKLKSATTSEKATIAEKLRSLTPGSEEIIERWELEKRK
jgi:uncharacterized protein YggE